MTKRQGAEYGGTDSQRLDPYWSRPAATVLTALGSSNQGLSASAARGRQRRPAGASGWQPNLAAALRPLVRQFTSPLVLILVFAAAVAGVVGEGGEAIIIMAIVLASGMLGFAQEFRASRAMDTLRKRLATTAMVRRDGADLRVPVEQVVPGDVLMLSAGALIPVDGIILEASDLSVSESALTGESFPVSKKPGEVPTETPLPARTNSVFAGTSVRSGTATVLVVKAGDDTEISRIAETLRRAPPETDFSRGVRHFGYLMMRIMATVVLIVFVINLLLDRPLIDSLLFSIALSVGLTPELLPAIISVTLSRGALRMSRSGVVVRKLDAIESLGTMDVLCTDKTGTLTEGVVTLDGWHGTDGLSSDRVLLLGRLNARLQTGMDNPMDRAIAASGVSPEEERFRKLGEIPYDFVRKRLSVAVSDPSGARMLICKGATTNVLLCCSSIQEAAKARPMNEGHRAAVEERCRKWSEDGFRVLAVASRGISGQEPVDRTLESDMCLEGFLLFFDPPKPGIEADLAALSARGIDVKIISGDNRHVARQLAKRIGLPSRQVMTGQDLVHLTRSALEARVERTDLFVEIDPNQKERIIAALRARKHVVGYLGDGINDAPALHEADVGISVDSAVDVAREAADIVLLRRDLGVLVRGVDDGRIIFANTMKYVFVTTSANLGNMVSMAVASLFLPFLPMLAKQILLNNFLSDLPCLAIASDAVDAAERREPHAWNMREVRRNMFGFGLLSSLFDLVTFGFLLAVTGASAAAFQTGWFVESLLTELATIFVIRTRHPFWTSRPSRSLSVLAVAVGLLAIAMPYLPAGGAFGLIPLPVGTLAGLSLITVAYALASEVFKQRFLRSNSDTRPRAAEPGMVSKKAAATRSSVRS